MIDNKPLVLLYVAALAREYDQWFIDYTKARFAEDFSGRMPFIAPQNSWGVHGDNVCAWGGALGLNAPGIGELGPGYDHSAVPGRRRWLCQGKGAGSTRGTGRNSCAAPRRW